MNTKAVADWSAIVLDTLNAVRSRNGSSAARAMIDAVASHPAKLRTEDDVLRIPAQIGPWTIVREKEGFTWYVAESVSSNDQLRFHVRPYKTARSNPDLRRILLIGESTAGSWGFFGKLSLARLVEVALGEERCTCEVVDLSCVNANWRDNCLPLTSAGMTLDPDVVIVFCGNNEARWLLPSVLQDDDWRQANGFQLRWSYTAGDVQKTLEHVRSAYLSVIETAVYDTVATCRAFGKPVLFVIPPYNFRDWSPLEQFPVLLAENQRVHWAELIESASRALTRGDLVNAENLADAAVRVDQGESQRALFMRGCARRRAGKSNADQDFRDAMYAGLGAFVQAVPSLPLPAAQRIADTLRVLDVPALNLASIFADAAADEVDPLLLDYCHLGRRGIAVAASEIARAVKRQFWPPSGSASRELANDSGAVRREMSSEAGKRECAVAFVCAALHGHQNGQTSEFVRGWLRRAMQETDAVASLLRLLQRVACTYYREWLTLEELRRARIGPDLVDDRSAIFILKFIYHARLDYELCTMLAEVLGDANPTAEIERQTQGQLEWLGGDLKRMFFMDVRKGFGLFQREMSRREWERAAREFVATDYRGQIDFFGSQVAPRNLLLRLSPPTRRLEVKCRLRLNGHLLAELHLKRAHLQVRLPLGSAPFHVHLNKLSFEWDRMIGAVDVEATDDRASFVAQFGPYPIAAVISELRFDLDDGNDELGSRWL